jgi:hypothetical protein
VVILVIIFAASGSLSASIIGTSVIMSVTASTMMGCSAVAPGSFVACGTDMGSSGCGAGRSRLTGFRFTLIHSGAAGVEGGLGSLTDRSALFSTRGLLEVPDITSGAAVDNVDGLDIVLCLPSNGGSATCCPVVFSLAGLIGSPSSIASDAWSAPFNIVSLALSGTGGWIGPVRTSGFGSTRIGCFGSAAIGLVCLTGDIFRGTVAGAGNDFRSWWSTRVGGGRGGWTSEDRCALLLGTVVSRLSVENIGLPSFFLSRS